MAIRSGSWALSDSSVLDVIMIYLIDSLWGIPFIFLFSSLLLLGFIFLSIAALQDENWRDRFWMNPLWQKAAAIYLFGVLSFSSSNNELRRVLRITPMFTV